jgi:hypothetical protein
VCVYTQKRDRASSSSSFFIHRFDFVSLYTVHSSLQFFLLCMQVTGTCPSLRCDVVESFSACIHTQSNIHLFFFIFILCVYVYVVICLFHAANKFSTMLLYLMIQLTGLWISDKRKFQKEFWKLPIYSICCLYLACIYYMHSRKYIYFPLILIHNNLISTRKSIVPFLISQIIQVPIYLKDE